jgi:hypothetical protein
MKIKRFGYFLNEMKKGYGDDFSLRDINPGEVVTYMGTRYHVIDSNEVILELSKDKDAKKGDKGNFLVNRGMFKQNGSIPG